MYLCSVLSHMSVSMFMYRICNKKTIHFTCAGSVFNLGLLVGELLFYFENKYVEQKTDIILPVCECVVTLKLIFLQ